MALDMSVDQNWLIDIRNIRMSNYKEVKPFIQGWSDFNKKTLFVDMAMNGLDFPGISRKELVQLLDDLVLLGKLPASLQISS